MERRQQQRRLQRRERLTTALLLKISIWAISIVVVASAITFITTYNDARKRVIELLQQDLKPTLELNQALFRRIEQHGEILTEQFLQRYQLLNGAHQPLQHFNQWYEETSPGVVRLKPEFNRGIAVEQSHFQHLSAFLGPREQPLTDELKTRVIAAQYTLNALGPAWQNVVGNTHFSMPENVLILYSPESPWGLLADKDLVITDFSVVKSTLQSENPQRAPNWTGLYHDISADVWTITYQRPIDLKGQHLANASFDIELGSLLTDLTQRKRLNSEHMVLNARGDLIAASNLSTEQMQDQATLTADNYQEPLFQAVNDVIADNAFTENPAVIESDRSEQLMIIDKIAGPDWWHVTVYPLAEIRKQAMVLPLRLVAAGIGLVLLTLLMTYLLVRREVSKPLQEVATVASLMGQRNYHDALARQADDINARGEVKQALDAFKTMATRFLAAQNDLEQQVEARTAELAEANKQLDAMAYLDGLTGLLNRRAFDRDLEAVKKSTQGHYLIIADIDEFKPYNDNYGHEAGDQALKKIATRLVSETSANVYRYGGEELALIMPADSGEQVHNELEKLREGVVELAIPHHYKQAELAVLTLSMGAAPINPQQSNEENIRRADRQLYHAKHQGRNRVCVSS